MNKELNLISENVALEYLKKSYDINNIEKIQNPDFKAGDKLFEVKKFEKNGKYLFTKRQGETFDLLNPMILVVKSNDVVENMYWNEFKHKFKIKVSNFHFVPIHSEIYEKIENFTETRSSDYASIKHFINLNLREKLMNLGYNFEIQRKNDTKQ